MIAKKKKNLSDFLCQLCTVRDLFVYFDFHV